MALHGGPRRKETAARSLNCVNVCMGGSSPKRIPLRPTLTLTYTRSKSNIPAALLSSSTFNNMARLDVEGRPARTVEQV